MKNRKFALCAVLGAAALLVYLPRHTSNRQGRPNAFAVHDALEVSPIERSLRRQFPYSVVPGGVYSPRELREKVYKDPVVAAHYADFNLSKTHLVVLDKDQIAYVSYRVRDRIYWSHRTVRVCKGETLLTDGHNFARTRCGNRLSRTSRTPPTFDRRYLNSEPVETALDLQPDSKQVTFQVLPEEAPVTASVHWLEPIPVFPLELSGPVVPMAFPVPPASNSFLAPPGSELPLTTGFPLIGPHNSITPSTTSGSGSGSSVGTVGTTPGQPVTVVAVAEPVWGIFYGLMFIALAVGVKRVRLSLAGQQD